jgi:hypothetical protein
MEMVPMKSLKTLYFGESIKESHHKRISKQLQNGNPKMKKDIHTIIFKEKGDNLFEYLELSSYLKLYELNSEFWLVGAVADYEEFTLFITDFFNDCLDRQVPINKADILDYLMHKEF